MYLDFVSPNLDVLDLGGHGQVSGTHVISTKVWLARLFQMVIHALQLSNEGLLLLVLVLARLAGQELYELGGEQLLASAAGQSHGWEYMRNSFLIMSAS